MELRLAQSQTQKVNLQLVMQSVTLFETPGIVLDSVINAIALNPEKVNNLLKERRTSEKSSGGIKALFVELIGNSSNQSSRDNNGIIAQVSLEKLVDVIGEGVVVNIVPDVSYIGRKLDFPLIEFAPYLAQRPDLKLLTIPPNFANAQKLYNFLLKEREWIASEVRTIGGIIAGRQREYLATLNPLDLRVFPYSELAKDLGLHESNAFRLCSKRKLSIESADGRTEIHPFRHLLSTRDDIIRYDAIAELNGVLASEPGLGTAYSDEEIAKRTRAARRTIAKYRTDAGIPHSRERAEFYAKNQLTVFSIPYFTY